MKTIPINVIGYGHWGSRLSKKLEEEGLFISSLVTDQENILVNYEKKYSKKQLNLINWEIPTFVTTGPLYHHKILDLAESKVFVEKPFYILGQSSKQYKNKPYVNYQWLNSSKLNCIKNCLGEDWEKLEIEMVTTTNVARNFSIIEDFMPHIVSILFNGLEEAFSIIHTQKISKTLYAIELEINKKIVFIKIGIGEERITKFKTNDILVVSNNPYYVYKNEIQIVHDKDPLSESISRYLNYFRNNECEEEFISNKFHNKVLDISRLIINNLK